MPLEAWFFPARGSSKLIIANHPPGFSRSGIPTHLQPWHADWAPSGNGFEVDLVPDYKILYNADTTLANAETEPTPAALARAG